jgi:hypothetical protein
MMQDGQVFALPMPERLTVDTESLSQPQDLMPTPNTMEHLPARTGEARERQLFRGGSESRRSSSGNLREDILDLVNLPTPTVADVFTANLASSQQSEGSMHSVSLAQAVVRPDLMPTPTTRDYKDGTAEHKRDGVVQTDTVARAVFNSGEVKMLPTLRASDGYERRNQKTMDKIAREGGDMTMPTLARTTTDWGKFEPAIRRWEQTLDIPAPAPTKPDGKDGAHRLSSQFTEWMMGLEPGWITDCGLTRNEELKAAGNGVVPQQAELALRILLAQTDFITDIE